MMQESDLPHLVSQVLWASFVLALVFGAIAQRTHFCTMGAVADIVNIGDWTRMRMWLHRDGRGDARLQCDGRASAGSKRGTALYGGPRVIWLSALVGGAMFGFGMVFGSGCGSKTLVRVGGGNLKSLVVFGVIGLTAFATLKGITAVARVATVDTVALTLGTGQDLPSIASAAFGIGKAPLAAVLGLAIGGALIAWSVSVPDGRGPNALFGGIGIGAVIVGVWWVTGRLGHLAEDPNTLQEAFVRTPSGRMEALSFVAPVAYTLDWLMFFSDRSKVLTTGIVSVVGVVMGSAAVALARRTFRWEGFRDAGDTGRHLAGATLMGVGGVTALGCTIGQGDLGTLDARADQLHRVRGDRHRRGRRAAPAGLADRALGVSDVFAPADHAEGSTGSHPTDADFDGERRFGGLRRLHGDAGYARIRAARIAIVGVGGVGSWCAEALARRRRRGTDADRPRPCRRVEHQPAGAGPGQHARNGEGRGAAIPHRRHPSRMRRDGHRGVRRCRELAGCAARARRCRDRRLRPGACQGRAGGLGARRKARAGDGRRRRRQASAAGRRSRRPRADDARPAARGVAPAPPPAPRGRAHTARSASPACTRARRWRCRPMPALSTAGSIATATARASR